MKYKLTIRRTDSIEINTAEPIGSKSGLNAIERQLSEQAKDQIEILGWEEVVENAIPLAEAEEETNKQ